MNWNDITETFTEWISKIFLSIFIVCLILGSSKGCKEENIMDTTTPVEIEEIDSLISTNEILIINIDSLDIAKHDEITKIKSLDNDSTLKLFYELIRKE